MKKFVFKLEPVLNIRKQKEEEIQLLLAKAQEKLNAALSELKAIHGKRLEIATCLENFKRNPTGIDDLIIYQNYLDVLDQQVLKQEIKISDIYNEIEEIRCRLVEACRDKKIMEKMKEKQKNKHASDALRMEIGFLDEVGALRNARKNIGK